MKKYAANKATPLKKQSKFLDQLTFDSLTFDSWMVAQQPTRSKNQHQHQEQIGQNGGDLRERQVQHWVVHESLTELNIELHQHLDHRLSLIHI